MAAPVHEIRFPVSWLRTLRSRLLRDLSNEAYGVLLAKKEDVSPSQTVYTVKHLQVASTSDYEGRSTTHLKLKKAFVFEQLAELTARSDVDTIIDVHTHPFSQAHVSFSGVDDNDEVVFREFLHNKLQEISYLSIVFSQTEYDARVWLTDGRDITNFPALVRPQLPSERIDRSAKKQSSVGHKNLGGESRASRTIAALGTEYWKNISRQRQICIVGAGGLGSVIAENLVHLGFSNLVIIDHDTAEDSNLNRVVGLYEADVQNGRKKALVVKRHLKSINSSVSVHAFVKKVEEKRILPILAHSEMLIVATDNHSSRAYCQDVCLKYFVPLFSAGVNISVRDGHVDDVSGECIVVRAGDKLCLYCLGRLNSIQIAAERHPSAEVRSTLVTRGYVAGAEVITPAVKTLNSSIAALICDRVINHYTERQAHEPILVYENNAYPTIYSDTDSVQQAYPHCYSCDIVDDL